jgi:ABC-type spermidine/putrescine transport system permease subunit I
MSSFSKGVAEQTGGPGSRRMGYGMLAAPLLVAMLALFILPIVDVLRTSIYTDRLTLALYARAFSEPIYIRVLWTTLKIAGLATIICLLVAYPFAYCMARASQRVQALLFGVVTLSFLISLLVKNYAWTLLLQDTGLVNTALLDLGLRKQPLPLMYNLFGVTVAMVHALLPFMVLPIYGALVRLDPRLGQASQSLGAGPALTFLRITLPLSLPGVGAGVFLVFVASLGFFITPALLGSPQEMMLSNLIDNQIRTALNWPFGSALAVILLVIALLSYVAYARIFGAERAWDQL